MKSDFSEEINYHSRARSTHIAPVKMQQGTTDSSLTESNVGIPNRFCSVCGDTSTGNHCCFSFLKTTLFRLFCFLQAFTSVEIAVKAAKHSFAGPFNVNGIKTTNVLTMVNIISRLCHSIDTRSKKTTCLIKCSFNSELIESISIDFCLSL